MLRAVCIHARPWLRGDCFGPGGVATGAPPQTLADRPTRVPAATVVRGSLQVVSGSEAAFRAGGGAVTVEAGLG
jgi:hypothetical protein